MDNLDDHFSHEDNEFLSFCKPTFMKRLAQDNGDPINDLSPKNMNIWAAAERRFPDFSDFVLLPNENITLDDLHRLQGKYIILEYDGGMLFNITDCSAVACMKVMKHNEVGQFYYDHDVLNKGIVVTPHYSESIYRDTTRSWRVMVGKDYDIFPEGELITIEKLTEPSKGRKNDKKHNFVWKIWVPRNYLNVSNH